MGSKMVEINELTTIDDIARRYKMSIGTTTNIVCNRDRKRSHFPQPIHGKGTRAIWLWSDVEQWFTKNPPKKPFKGKKNSYVNQHFAIPA